MNDLNYPQWRRLFESVFAKFDLAHHVTAAPDLITTLDPDWKKIASSIVNWLYATVSREVFDVVRLPDANAFQV